MRWQEFDNPEEEQKLLKEMIRKNPKDSKAYYDLGTVWAYMFTFDLTIECCERAIALDPKNTTYHAFISYVSTKIGDNKRAIDELATIIELGEDESDYYVDVALGEQKGVDRNLAEKKISLIRQIGKDQVADKLQEWLLK